MLLWDMLSFVSAFFQVSYRSVRFLIVHSFILGFLSVEKLCANCGFAWRVRGVVPERISGGPSLPEYALQEKICLL